MIAFAVSEALEDFRRELLVRRRRDAEIKRKYGVTSLNQMIGELDAKLIDYEIRKVRGENIPEALLWREKRRKEALEARLQRLEETLEREVTLTPTTPRLLGVARVVPAEETMHSDAEIEAIGMEVAMRYEREQGRQPEDVSSQNLGYDIRSTDPGGGVRYIEVKARAHGGAVALTPNEWLMARRLGEDFWLYIVENAATSPTLYRIQNPAQKLSPKEIVETVRYLVEAWKHVAESE